MAPMLASSSSASRVAPPPPSVVAGALASLATLVAALPFDALLCGMVAAGQGVEAICLYLGLTRAALDAAVARLGLPAPHGRPLRRPAHPHAWSAEDTFRLIAWRIAKYKTSHIARQFGRSPKSVRARCRRLGVPTPARGEVRVWPWKKLPDVAPDHFARGLFPEGGGRCGTVGVSGAPYLPPALGRGAGDARNPGASAIRLDTPGRAATAAPDVSRAEAPDPAGAGLSAGAAPGELYDLSYVRDLKARRRSRRAVTELAHAYFGGQKVTAIAARAGITATALQSLFHHLDMPRGSGPGDRGLFSGRADDRLGRARFEASGWEVATCGETGNLFFRHRSKHAGVRVCRAKRFERGTLDANTDRYRCNTVALASLPV